MVKDPVCGMRVDERIAPSSDYAGTTYSFCSSYCKEQFDQQPERYARQEEKPGTHQHQHTTEQ